MDPRRLSQLPGPASDRVRIAVLTVMLLILGGAYVWTRRGAGPAEGAPVEDQYAPQEEPENAPAASRVDPARLAGVRDATPAERVTFEPEARQHLLQEALRAVPGDFRRLGAQRVEDALFQAILAEPAAYRGRALTVKGFFAFAVERKVPMVYEAVTGEKTVWEGLIQDDLGHGYSFTVTDPPERIEQGQVVRLEGFFLKRAAVYPPDPAAEPVDDTLHLVGRRLVRSFLRMEPVHQLSRSLLDDVRDAQIDDQMQIEEDALYHVLSFVQNVDADTLSDYAVDSTHWSLKHKPEEYRGAAVRVMGTFVDVWPRALGAGGENPLELGTVYHGLLVHGGAGGPNLTYFISPEPRPEWLTPHTNLIVEGVFLKTYLFQTKGGEAVAAPLVIARRFVPFRVDTSGIHDLMFWACVVLGGMCLGWFLLSTFGDRKANEDFRRRYYEHKRRQVRDRLGPPAPRGPETSA